MSRKIWVAGDRVDAADINANFKFGGDGSDGALAITSGATDIDVGGASVYVLNYTSVSITGTGSLTFSNPHANGTIIIIKVQGDVTLTSSTAPMIDASGIGATGGSGGAGNGSDGTVGLNGNSIMDDAIHYGGRGQGGVLISTVEDGGVGGLVYEIVEHYTRSLIQLSRMAIILACGSGGGGGGGGQTQGATPSLTGGDGGRGGGGLIIECGGAWNFTTALGISVAGKDGSDAPDETSSVNSDHNAGGGGGGGAGGFCIVLYNTLTGNTGTIDCSGGDGGDGGNTDSGATGGGTGSGSGAGGGGGGADGGAGGDGADGVTGDSNGTAGNNAGGRRAGAGGGSGSSQINAGAGVNTGGVGGTGGATENVLVAENIWFA